MILPIKLSHLNFLLPCLGWLLMLLSLSGLWDKQWWVFDVLNHFHWHLLLLSIGLLVLVLLIKNLSLMSLGGISLSIVINFWYLLPFLLLAPPPAQAQSIHSTSVLFANVHIDNSNVEQLTQLVKQTNPDIVITAETSNVYYQALQVALPEYSHHTHGPGRGIYRLAMFSKLTPDATMTAVAYDGQVLPAMESVLEVNGKKFKVVGLHPNPPISERATEERDTTLEKISESLADSTMPLIVAGDFNNGSNSWSMEAFRNKLDLKDSRIGRGRQPSWPTMIPGFLRINLDHIFISESLSVIDYQVLSDIGSDHSPVFVKVTF